MGCDLLSPSNICEVAPRLPKHNQSQFLWFILSWSKTQPVSTRVPLLWQPWKRPSSTDTQMREIDFSHAVVATRVKIPHQSKQIRLYSRLRFRQTCWDFFTELSSMCPFTWKVCVCVPVCVSSCSKAESQTPSKLSLAWCATPIREVEIIGCRINTPLSLAPPLSSQPPSLMLRCHLTNSQ